MSVRPSRNRASGAIPLLAALHKKSWAVIDRPYSLGFAAVGALYERPRCISCAKPPPHPMTGPRHHVRDWFWKSAAIHSSGARFLGKLVEIKKTIRADSMLAGCVRMLLDIDFDSFPIPLIVAYLVTPRAHRQQTPERLHPGYRSSEFFQDSGSLLIQLVLAQRDFDGDP